MNLGFAKRSPPQRDYSVEWRGVQCDQRIGKLMSTHDHVLDDTVLVPASMGRAEIERTLRDRYALRSDLQLLHLGELQFLPEGD